MVRYACDALRGLFFKLFKARTRAFDCNNICKHSGKFEQFNMCVSQNIVKASFHPLLFKLKCFDFQDQVWSLFGKILIFRIAYALLKTTLFIYSLR